MPYKNKKDPEHVIIKGFLKPSTSHPVTLHLMNGWEILFHKGQTFFTEVCTMSYFDTDEVLGTIFSRGKGSPSRQCRGKEQTHDM